MNFLKLAALWGGLSYYFPLSLSAPWGKKLHFVLLGVCNDVFYYRGNELLFSWTCPKGCPGTLQRPVSIQGMTGDRTVACPSEVTTWTACVCLPEGLGGDEKWVPEPLTAAWVSQNQSRHKWMENPFLKSISDGMKRRRGDGRRKEKEFISLKKKKKNECFSLLIY